jgi:hypothetical protein
VTCSNVIVPPPLKVSGADTHYHIDIEEPPECDVLQALRFMHADVPALDLPHCSALRYAHTAHFLDMRRLGQEVIGCASEVIRAMAAPAPPPASARGSSGPGLPLQANQAGCQPPSTSSSDSDSDSKSKADRGGGGGGGGGALSPWDAIAALTLLGDPQKVLALVSLRHWYER